MFKTLKTLQAHVFLRNSVTRHFADYSDTGEYHFLDKLNYIGNRGIFWSHPQSSFIIRVTSDYDQCLQGNQSNDDNTCWWYFPERIQTVMKKDFSERDVRTIENEIRNWKLIQNASKESIDWCAGAAARCYGWFSQHSTEQKKFAAKHFISAFYTDDVIERLISNPKFNSAADEFLNNLNLIINGKSSQVTDMRKLKGRDKLLDSYIERAIETIEIQKETMQLAKQVLKPKIFDFFILGCLHYLSGVAAEKPLFHQHFPGKTVIREQEGKFARHRSIGVMNLLPTMMTDEATPFHLNHQNPAVDFAILLTIFGNDTAGYFRDNFVDFSPMTYFDTSSSGQSDLSTAKILANRANKMKKAILYVWETVPAENAKHYEYLAKYVGIFLDFHFVLGLRHANYRYGWIPKLDSINQKRIKANCTSESALRGYKGLASDKNQNCAKNRAYLGT